MLLTSMLESDSDRYLVERLYLRYSAAMKKEAINIVDDELASEDLVQKAFVRIINKIDVVKNLSASQQVSYLAIVIINLSIDHYRKRELDEQYIYYGATGDIADDIYDFTYNPLDVYMRKASYKALGEAILKLERKDRFLLHCKFFEDMSEKQIAKKLGIKEQNVSTYLFRAKKRLANIIMADELEQNAQGDCESSA